MSGAILPLSSYAFIACVGTVVLYSAVGISDISYVALYYESLLRM